jgi:hypothetical protein
MNWPIDLVGIFCFLLAFDAAILHNRGEKHHPKDRKSLPENENSGGFARFFAFFA